jgi:predicted DCC family thiol-disulfide oxidoreductase YuxK
MLSDPQLLGWVLYDDSCGFCRRWVPFWASTLRARGYDIAALQTPWVRERLAFLGATDELLLEDILLLPVEGEIVRGAEVYRRLLRSIWWAYPLGVLAGLPGLKVLFDRAYRTFARNRYCVSRVCGLKEGAVGETRK